MRRARAAGQDRIDGRQQVIHLFRGGNRVTRLALEGHVGGSDQHGIGQRGDENRTPVGRLGIDSLSGQRVASRGLNVNRWLPLVPPIKRREGQL